MRAIRGGQSCTGTPSLLGGHPQLDLRCLPCPPSQVLPHNVGHVCQDPCYGDQGVVDDLQVLPDPLVLSPLQPPVLLHIVQDLAHHVLGMLNNAARLHNEEINAAPAKQPEIRHTANWIDAQLSQNNAARLLQRNRRSACRAVVNLTQHPPDRRSSYDFVLPVQEIHASSPGCLKTPQPKRIHDRAPEIDAQPSLRENKTMHRRVQPEKSTHTPLFPRFSSSVVLCGEFSHQPGTLCF
ncbi:hypothetical protein NDU88_004787 [Pleurodeles waltl]|uniref:Uncharacterized protein n=1 Tax=Pleurodeles waltl TaxID=8319 RepID=A0AAV7QG59_PLEWA|nr:hypothetical protein NDU88_004787 [Pleurodeles waltl]